MAYHLFVAGVPATGKTWLGCWLAERGYIHIDAEKNQGADFDRVGLHGAWDQLIAARQALPFVKAANALGKPVVVNWGFRLCYLYVVTALQSEGVAAWWLHANREQARAAFVARGGLGQPFPQCSVSELPTASGKTVRSAHLRKSGPISR